jgi:protoporphyrinogen oxidase
MKVAVIGAGMAGLVSAYRLALEGDSVDVYERWPGLGGQVATLDLGDGCRLEHYYHHLFTTDHYLPALYEELGMPDDMEWHESSVAIFTEGRSHPFTGPLDLLRFRPISLRSRVRMGLAVLRLQRGNGRLEDYEGLTAASWIEDAMGSEPWENVWRPLLRGKFGDRAEEISMAWLWSKLNLRRPIKGRETRHELLGYPRGSWQPVLERLRDQIERHGGRVLIDRPVAELSRRENRLVVAAGAPDSFRRGLDPRRFEVDGADEYDAVLATVPNDIFIELLEPGLAGDVGDEYLNRLRSIEYQAALCMLLELDRQFSPYYWTNVVDRDIPFVGLVEQTNLIAPRRYGGRRFLYVANYLDRSDPLLALSPEQLLDRYEPGLRKVNPGFSRDWIKQMWVFREPSAQPLVTLGYRDRIPPLQTGVPGLLLANTTQIYPEDRGTNHATRLAYRAVEQLKQR